MIEVNFERNCLGGGENNEEAFANILIRKIGKWWRKY